MNITANLVLEKNHAFNHQVHAYKRDAMKALDKAYVATRGVNLPAMPFGRVGKAFVANAAWGAWKGVDYAFLRSLLFGPTPFSLGAQKLRLPIGFGFGLRAGGLFTLGYIAAGEHRPMSDAERSEAGALRDFKKFEDGLLFTPAIKILKSYATGATHEHKPNLARACLWGAALVSIVATVVRLGTGAIFTGLAFGCAVPGAAIAGCIAAAVQLFQVDDDSVVDFEGIDRWARNLYA